MSLSREENIYMTKVSEQTERFEDMLNTLNQLSKISIKNFPQKKIYHQLPTKTQLDLEEQLGELFLVLSKKKNLRDPKIFSSSKTSRMKLKKSNKSSLRHLKTFGLALSS